MEFTFYFIDLLDATFGDFDALSYCCDDLMLLLEVYFYLRSTEDLTFDPDCLRFFFECARVL